MGPEKNSLTNSLISYCVGGFYTASTGGPGTTNVVVVSAVTTSSTTSLSTGTIGIYVSYQLPIVIRYEASDVSLFSSFTSTASTSSSTATDTASPSETSGSSNGLLSSGASIGLGVGLGVGVSIILVLAALLFWTRRKKARRAANTVTVVSKGPTYPTEPYDPHIYSQHEAKGSASEPPATVPYQPPQQVYEVDAGYNGPSELPTHWEGHEAGSVHQGSGPRYMNP
jgi:hypothetical protein